MTHPAGASVVVIGNGAAGTLVVVSLLREAARAGTAVRVDWVGDGPTGRGVAYATPAPWHRLNVPAAGMSLAEATEDFPSWLVSHGLDDDAFAPRHAFGSYLLVTLENARAAAAGTVELREHHDRAVGIGLEDGRTRVELGSGEHLRADRVVLALGPFPGAPLSDDPSLRPVVIDDPWTGDGPDVGEDDRVLLVGTGLTMVDVALSIARRRPRATILAVSRTGLTPRAHRRDEGDADPPPTRPGATFDEAVTDLEARVAERGEGWREVVDGLRPVTQQLWQDWSREDQRRFLAEQARRWEVHRHRMAPSVATELDALVDEGRLTLDTAGLGGLTPVGGRVRARLEGPEGPREVDVDRVVSCTGARDDVTAVDDPLVASLLHGGAARAHPLGLGFDTTVHGAMRTDAGTSDRLFGIGTLRRGELYETTAVPEIRQQAADLARFLVGGGR